MTYAKFILTAAFAACAASGIAQTMPAASDPASAGTPLPHDRGYDKASPRTEAIDASGRPAVRAANADVAEQADAQTANTGEQSPQYAADMAAYRQALIDRHHAMAADQRHYAHQQRAYADAMYAWRRQVAACHHGNGNACRASTPDPAAFW